MRYRSWMIGALLVVAATTSALARDMTPRQVADAYLAAWNAHDVDAAAALMADDVTYLDVTVGDPQKGRDAARDKVIKLFVTAAPDLTWKMRGEPIEAQMGSRLNGPSLAPIRAPGDRTPRRPASRSASTE